MSNPRGVIDFRVLHTRIRNRPWSMKTNQARILLASSFNTHWWQKSRLCAVQSRCTHGGDLIADLADRASQSPRVFVTGLQRIVDQIKRRP